MEPRKDRMQRVGGGVVSLQGEWVGEELGGSEE